MILSRRSREPTKGAPKEETPCGSASTLTTRNKLTKLRDIRDSLWSLEAGIGQMECLLEAVLGEIEEMLKDIEEIFK